MNPHFAFRLRRDENNYYKALNGTAQLLPPPTNPELNTEFDLEGIVNFNEEGIRWVRDNELKGIGTSYSESLQFALDALVIVEKVFYSGDIEAPLQLEVWRIDPSLGDYTGLYEFYFLGDVDLSTFLPDVDENNQAFVGLNIKEGGLTSLLKSNKTTPYEIELRDQDGTTYLNLDGVKLLGSFNFLAISSDDLSGGLGGVQFDPDERAIGVYAAHINDDGDFEIATTQLARNLSMQAHYSDPTFANSEAYDNFNLDPLQTMDIRVVYKQDWTIKYTLLGALDTAKLAVRLRITNVDHTAFTITENLYFDSVGVASGVTKSISIDAVSAQHTIEPGQRVYLTFYVVNGNSELTFNEGNMSIKSEFRLTATNAATLTYYRGCQLFFAEMTAGQYGFRSDYLSDASIRSVNNYPANTMMTCGDALRELENPRMVLTLSDLNKDWFCRWGLGLGIESGTIRVEPLSHFYDKDSEIYFFDDVNGFRVVPDLSKRGNLLRIGMQNEQYDSLNGKYEPDGEIVFKLPFKQQSDVDMLAPYRSDATGIEVLRANLSKKNTTDNKADKEIFIISKSDDYVVNPNDGTFSENVPVSEKVYSLYRPNDSTNTTGVLFPATNYNLDLTPKSNFYRNAPYIQMLCWKRDGEQITFQTTEKNPNLVTNFIDGRIEETANVSLPIALPTNGGVAEEAKPIYLPLLIQFTATTPANFHRIMLANPYGYIRVNYRGRDYMGFVNKAAQIDAENSEYDFELQMHPDCVTENISYA